MIKPFASFLFRSCDLLSMSGISPLAGAGRKKKGKILFLEPGVGFLKIVETPKEARVTREFIDMNYGHLSPYAEWSCTFFKESNRLLIWFYPRQDAAYSLVLPKSFLAWKAAACRNCLLYTRISEHQAGFFFLYQGELVEEFLKADFSKSADPVDYFRKFYTEKYTLDDLDCLELTKDYSLTGLRRLSLREFLGFLQTDFDGNQAVSRGIQALKPALIFFLAVFIGVSYLKLNTLNRAEQKISHELNTLAESNTNLKGLLRQSRPKREFWSRFYQAELVGRPVLDILEHVTAIVAARGSVIREFQVRDQVLAMRIESSNLTGVMDDLLESGYFRDLSLQGSVKKEKETGLEQARLQGVIKDSERPE